ncbi:MAG TPA: hypothetical protein VE441_14205, partial [Mycobacterium sp.]|nr:hypothetical protein [Mycobacterium sp.]
VARRTLEDASRTADAGQAPTGAPATARTVADVADKLARHKGRGDPERTAQIRRWCDEAAQQFVGAPVQAFVPILVEHIVRNRMMESRAVTTSPVTTSAAPVAT